ncbi:MULTISPECIES: hypothetical protein [Burkholderia]|uniref:Uncharacterized protein n=1 Tax=Burkholderia paludis TaxID=1506587 RepID=A0A6J5F4Z3_9BURK|nr:MULTISPECIES: hypothetical protein [Burkholderia]CAB3772256.1 hypothetical protein LMG30113_06650 [Burkholderia paludis]VWC42536.1 hypothetical protein BPA30113_07031 [Burkholderia paludis]
MIALTVRSREERLAIPRSIQKAIAPVLSAKLSYLQEACAFAFGVSKDASLVAAIDAGKTFGREDFSLLRFVERYTALSGDRFGAEACALAIDDITLQIEIDRYSEVRQRHDRYLDLAYGIRVRVDGLSADARAETPIFALPDAFGGAAGGIGIRVASNHDHKFAGEYPISAKRNAELLTAKLVEGKWAGAAYIDLPYDGADDARAIGSVKAALARAIVPVIDPWVRCSIFRPDGYSDRVWRVHLSLGSTARAALGGSTLVFDLPQHQQRFFRPDTGFLFDLNPEIGVHKGRFMDSQWLANMQSNGVSEAENEVPIGELRAMLIRNVNIALGRK